MRARGQADAGVGASSTAAGEEGGGGPTLRAPWDAPAPAAAAADDSDDSRSSTGAGNVDIRTPSAKVRARYGISVTQNILYRVLLTFAVRNMPLI